MPSRYIEKLYGEQSFHHIFNRGAEKREVFLDEDDYNYFLFLIDRYLGVEPKKDVRFRLQPNYSESLELVAYCLMPNHFHLLLYQEDAESVTKFMRSLGTAYSMYFNKKYERVGKLFQGIYKAVPVDNESYFTHVHRYIHLNPLDIGQNYLTYKYSSLSAWIGQGSYSWLKPEKMLSEFSSPEEYLLFLADYKSKKAELDEIKKALKDFN